MRTLLVTSIKDEGPYLLEWVAFHKSIGFSDIVIFENDSSDLSPKILDRLDRLGEIKFVPNLDFTGSPQMSAFNKCTRLEVYKESEWVFCIDCDEFFVPKDSDGLEDFLDRYQDATAIAINWLNFGSSRKTKWEDAPVTARFNQCASAVHPTNKYFKSFHRPSDAFRGFGIHRPWPRNAINSFIYPDGETVEEDVQLGAHPSVSDKLAKRHAYCSLNHYSVKSEEEYERKKLRGNGADPRRPYGAGNQFKRFDTNMCENNDIQRHTKAWSGLTELLCDPELSALHQASCAHHFPRA